MSLKSALEELVSNLQGTGYEVKPYMEENPYPPVINVVAVDPWVEKSDMLSRTERIANFMVVCMVETKPNEFMSYDLIDMVEKVLQNVGDWTVVYVPAPTELTIGNSQYLGCMIQVSHEFELE